MKVSNTVVTVIVVIAVLIFAYGVGLLIRHARTGSKPTQADQAAAKSLEPRVARSQDTPEVRAKIKEERAKAIEKMSTATEEQKEEFRNQVAKRFEGRRGGKKSQNRSLPEQPAPTVQPSSPPQTEPAQQAATPPAAAGESTSTKPGTDQTGSEAGKAGPG